MTKDIFRDRERGEEDAYFRQQDAKLIAKLRQKAQFSEIAHVCPLSVRLDPIRNGKLRTRRKVGN
jgi:hypothetical protein